MNVHPHPDPLPQERENRRPSLGQSDVSCSEVSTMVCTKETRECSRGVAALFPLLGERIKVRASIPLFILLFLSCSFVHAQSFTIDWFTIDGGGGTSTGGVYSVSGSVGQPDAGAQPMTGGNFSLVGGFWSLFAVQTPGAPLL